MPSEKALAIHIERLAHLIYEIRGQKVMLDADLAEVYGVPTRTLNQAVKRNRAKFPPDFMFRLTAEELEEVRSQIATGLNRSQIVIGSQKHRDPRYRPYAFTEHGAIMAANTRSASPATAVRSAARVVTSVPTTVIGGMSMLNDHSAGQMVSWSKRVSIT